MNEELDELYEEIEDHFRRKTKRELLEVLMNIIKNIY